MKDPGVECRGPRVRGTSRLVSTNTIAGHLARTNLVNGYFAHTLPLDNHFISI